MSESNSSSYGENYENVLSKSGTKNGTWLTRNPSTTRYRRFAPLPTSSSKCETTAYKWRYGGVDNDFVRLVTYDPKVAESYGFVDESEFQEDNADDLTSEDESNDMS